MWIETIKPALDFGVRISFPDWHSRGKSRQECCHKDYTNLWFQKKLQQMLDNRKGYFTKNTLRPPAWSIYKRVT